MPGVILLNPITGTVNLSEAVQVASGSVTGLLVGGQPVGLTNPIPITGSISVSAPVVQNVTGSAWTPQVVITGSVPLTGTFGLSGPITGTVGLSGPITGNVGVTNFPAVQTVTGSVGITGPVTGNVGVTNFPAVQTVTGSVGITAPVAVSNFPTGFNVNVTASLPLSATVVFPAVQTITGSVGLTAPITGNVGVTNFPAVQGVTGSVGITGPLTGTFGLSGPITGNVGVTNFPATQVVSASNWVPVVAQGPVASGSQPWNITGSVGLSGPITGNVGITAPVTVLPHQITSGSVTGLLVGGQPVSSLNPVPISGNLSVTFPAVQTVTGTVGLSGPITGTVGIAGPLTGTFGLSGPITGAVKITEAVQVVQASGTTPWSVTGTVGLSGPITGTVGLSGPITGTFGLSGPITGAVKITEAVQVVQASGTTPWSITGSVGLTGPVTGNVGVTNFPAVQTVTGSVGITGPVAVSNFPSGFNANITGSIPLPVQQHAVTISGSVPLIVTGSVVVTGQVNVQGNVTASVNGTVAVSNFPATQTVTGTVGLSGPITGTVAIAGPLTGTFGLSGPITGNVGITGPVSIADATGTGNLNALSASVQVNTSGLQTVGVQIAAGTLVGTVIPEYSYDGGTTWNPTYFSDPVVGTLAANVVFAASPNPSTAKVIIVPGGSGLVRIRVSAFTSGAATATVRASNTLDDIFLYEGVAGFGVPPTTIQIGATDGTNLRTVLSDTAGRLIITGSVGLSGPITGTVGLSGPITGTVGLSGPITGTVGLSGPITGAVKLTEAPQIASGSVVGILNGGQPTNGANPFPVTIAGNIGSVLATGSLSVGLTGTTAPLYADEIGGVEAATGKMRAVAVDSIGRIITAPAGAGSTNGFAYGTVATSAVTAVPVRNTTYTEQTGSMQRSLKSTSAADTSGSTGAMKVKVTFYDVTGSGPFTETVIMSGTAAGNMVSPNACYIERMDVVQVGSGQVAAGTISLFQSTNGNGGTIGSINTGDKQTFWAHHYVANNKTCYVTGMTGNNNNGSNQTIFYLTSQVMTTSGSAGGSVEEVLSDTVAEGAGVSQTVRTFGTPLAVAGPSRILMYAQPGGTPNITNRGSFDFYDQ